MANVQEINKLNSSFHFLGEMCEIKCIFTQPTTGAPVHVFNPKFKIIKSDGTDVNLRTLVPLSPTGIKEGEYKTSFLSDGITDGIYDLEFSGYYPDADDEKNKIVLTSKVEIFQVDSVQVLINMLRTQLHDHLPSLYWIDNTETYKWEDTDLYNALQMSVDAWNATPPVSHGARMATIDTFPYRNTLLEGAEYYALNQKYILENWNKLQYSDDISFQIDRTGGLLNKINILVQTWRNNLVTMKRDYAIRVLSNPKGIKSLRLPTRVLQQLSLTPVFSFLSSGY